jgi:hypothetical protein
MFCAATDVLSPGCGRELGMELAETPYPIGSPAIPDYSSA